MLRKLNMVISTIKFSGAPFVQEMATMDEEAKPPGVEWPGKPPQTMGKNITGWWFGTCVIFPISWDFFHVPTDINKNRTGIFVALSHREQ